MSHAEKAAVRPDAAVPRLYAGLDGCRGGWVCALWDGASRLELIRLDSAAQLFERHAPTMAAIDIPIGLPERAGAGGRTPERLVRPLLKGRRSSVFSVPARAAVMAGLGEGDEASRYRAACAVARAHSEPPRAVSKQGFHIFPKIAEVDRLLRRRPELVERLHECHPEVAFWAMNGCQWLDEPKKRKSRPYAPGLSLRIKLLAAAGLPIELLHKQSGVALGAGLDDLIDACACAWTAKRVGDGNVLRYPDPPERDAFGLPVCINA